MISTAQAGTLAEALGFDLNPEQLNESAAQLNRLSDQLTDTSIEEAIDRAGKPPYSRDAVCEDVTVEGEVAPGFESVRDAFTSNFQKGLERNAQLCVYRNGERVVDLWGTNNEPGMSTGPESGYTGDTIQSVYSSGKAIESTIFGMVVDRGLCAYDDLVVKYWPEFAEGGKDHLTIADILRHDAGLHAFSEEIAPDDIADIANPNGRLASIVGNQAPWRWAEGEFKGQIPRIYHAVTRGYVLSQILIRVDPEGRTLGKWLAEELAGPLGVDFYCGPHNEAFLTRETPEAEMHFQTGPDAAYQFANAAAAGTFRRVLQKPSPMEAWTAELEKDPLHPHSPEQDPQGRLTMGKDEGTSPQGFFRDPGHPDSRHLEISSASSKANARAMAAIMGMLANNGSMHGQQLISAEGIAKAVDRRIPISERPNGRFGMVGADFVNCGLGAQASHTYGWGGAGGSAIHFNDKYGTGFGYACTGFAGGLTGDQDRVGPLVAALRKSMRG
jgi:CubicO group peptidase (beta-lactamase class C family)